jgi:hypothetical protein
MTLDSLRYHAPYEATINCSGETHRLRWEAGGLTALDHADVEGERALAALGGTPCACVDALDGWAHHEDDLRVLIMTTRGPTDQLRSAERAASGSGAVVFPRSGTPIGTMIRQSSSGYRATAGVSMRGFAGARSASASASIVARGAGYLARRPGAPTPAVAQPDLASFLDLDGGLSDRLAVTVAATWAERVVADDPRVDAARATLIAALYGRVTCTVRAWLANPNLAVVLDMINPSTPPTISRSDDGIHIGLPFDWMVHAWGRGVAVILDRLVLAVLISTSDQLCLLTIDPTLENLQTVTVTIGGPDDRENSSMLN